jgi:hypothetical protein
MPRSGDASTATTSTRQPATGSGLQGPPVYPPFASALDELVVVAREGQRADAECFNPDEAWLYRRTRVFQDLGKEEQAVLLKEYEQIRAEGERANAEGKAARRAGPDAAFSTDMGGLAFFSQLGVARRPDLTRYFVDGFLRNRDALSFSEDDQKLFAEVLPYITAYMRRCFASGETFIQTDRQVCDAPGRSFHARQLLCGDRYLQLPLLWRQLTFPLPRDRWQQPPDIIELSLPHWLQELDLPAELAARIKEAGVEQLVFKAPTKGLSLHLGFDYVGEHKMGPLTIAMFLVKQRNGLAVQAALSLGRITTLQGDVLNSALVTIGPSLHGKSTLTIMIDPENSDLAAKLGIEKAGGEGVYPMNDDIVLLQRLAEVREVTRRGDRRRIAYSIDGTENNFYAVPFGLTKEDDPITYDVLRGAKGDDSYRELFENVVVDPESGAPQFLINPTRNMRAIFARPRLLRRKGVEGLLATITEGRLSEAVHVPLEETDRILWQAVMRENTVVPPLRRLRLEQYIRTLMYGEAVQMGAAAGAIGKPYVEYFSDPFIIGLEDENANLMYHILREMERGGQEHQYYAFNTGGIGAETSDEAAGPRYKKIPRDLTLMLQEALLRGAVVFEYDSLLGSDVAVAIADKDGREIVDLRKEWLPSAIYGDDEYRDRVTDVNRRRFYGRSADDKAGILRYTKVTDALFDIGNMPTPTNEREMMMLASFYWHVDQPYQTVPELAEHRHEGMRPGAHVLRALQDILDAARAQGLDLPAASCEALPLIGLADRG